MLIIDNKKARFHYEIHHDEVVGMVLSGWEVKSIKHKFAKIDQAWIKIIDGELWLMNFYINPWKFSQDQEMDPTRARKLLMKKKDILKLEQKMMEKSWTLIPLKILLQKGKLKCVLRIAKGRRQHEKKQVKKDRDLRREAQRMMKQF